MHLSHIDKVSIRVIVMTIISIFGLIYFFSEGGTILQLILIRIISQFLTASHTIGIHRWLCHYSFKPSTFGKYLMLTGLVSTGYGRPLYLAVAHGMHHKHTDTILDPHSPKHLNFLKIWLGRYTMHEDQYIIPTKFFRVKEAMFVNKHYWKLFFLFNMIIACIDLKTALVLSPLSFLYIWTFTAIITYYGHKQGDIIGPVNMNKVLVFLTLGEGLHKTHHDNPSSYDFGSEDRFDPGKKFIDLFLISKT